MENLDPEIFGSETLATKMTTDPSDTNVANMNSTSATIVDSFTIGTVLFALIGIGMITVIVIGNAFVLFAIRTQTRLRTNKHNWLIGSLATADLLVGLLVMPFTLVHDIRGEWMFGLVVCELWLALDVLFVTASILNLCAISLDRYFLVVDPVGYPTRRTAKRMYAMLAGIWIGALLVSMPPLVGWRPERITGVCVLSTEIDYVLYSAIGSFYLPVFIIIALYSRIFVISRRHMAEKQRRAKATIRRQATISARCANNKPDVSLQARRITAGGTAATLTLSPKASVFSRHCQSMVDGQREKPDDESIKSKNCNSLVPSREVSIIVSSSTPLLERYRPCKPVQVDNNLEEEIVTMGTMEENNQLKRLKTLKRKNQKASMMLGLILVCFIACWGPFFVIYVLGAFHWHATPHMFLVFFWLGYMNSGVNPIIYCILNLEFRHAFQTMLGLTERQQSARQNNGPTRSTMSKQKMQVKRSKSDVAQKRVRKNLPKSETNDRKISVN